jgi:hypothetical protein
MSQEERFVLLDVVGCWRILLIMFGNSNYQILFFFCYVFFSNVLGILCWCQRNVAHNNGTPV